MARDKVTMDLRRWKFRGKVDISVEHAKAKPEGVWAYGSLMTKTWDHGCAGKIYPCRTFITADIYDGSTREVIPDTVGQYSGILDKSEKELCENDIVRIAGIGNCLFKYIDGCFVFVPPTGNEPYWYPGEVLEDIELIVGNLQDNPELFKERDHGYN